MIWTVIQWELYPIPSALGSQISSGLVSSTVGDHVRSPGTVRFVQSHFCYIHSHPYIDSSFYFHHIAHHLHLQHSLYHEILTLKQTHFQRNRSLPTFFLSERLKAQPRRCSVGLGTVRSFRRVQISVERWNEIHQDLSHEDQSRTMTGSVKTKTWVGVVSKKWFTVLPLSLSQDHFSLCFPIQPQQLYTQVSDLRISRKARSAYINGRFWSNGFLGGSHGFNLTAHQVFSLWFWSIPWRERWRKVNRTIIICYSI